MTYLKFHSNLKRSQWVNITMSFSISLKSQRSQWVNITKSWWNRILSEIQIPCTCIRKFLIRCLRSTEHQWKNLEYSEWHDSKPCAIFEVNVTSQPQFCHLCLGCIACYLFYIMFDSSPPGQNGCYFADDTLMCIFMNEKLYILIIVVFPKGSIDNNPALV